MLVPPMSVETSGIKRERYAKSYCSCWNIKKLPISCTEIKGCFCGEDNDVFDWKWITHPLSESSWVVVNEDQKQVTFHPMYSLGTAAAKGDTPFLHNYHYYWEVKMLTHTYGTDIMVGVGSGKSKLTMNTSNLDVKFASLLGQDGESYGLSYKGRVWHNAQFSEDTDGFGFGSIVGVRVDFWQGTLQFYLNRKPQGVSFYNLRRHAELFPILCSTAAQSSMRLTYAASWRASLLVDAAKVLAAGLRGTDLPPGLQFTRRSHFWLTLPSGDCDNDDHDQEGESSSSKTEETNLREVLPTPYMHGFYVDSVHHNYPVVIWE
ncbi:SPRY domain-containing SOCS box protein 3-like isoform X2 [Pararge aegeria]|uniref:SPRY domain-containing SOCS box protein 3-like isoform X2 n=1 Tax=Pararge aegeria TaxID=116150 RepID=UPI0019D28BD7|nr:SPRY domain-containing SOCS box protein 3-like isoform X2 [Pararge aegeria]